MTKITKATFKSFLKKNAGNLHIMYESNFNGMTDSVETYDNQAFIKATETTDHLEHTAGIKGAWLVGSSRDYFREYEDDQYTGIHVHNSCGSFTVAILK